MRLQTLLAPLILTASMTAGATPFDEALDMLTANNLAPKAELMRSRQ